MARVFRSWDVDQGWLLPPSLHEFVPPGHMAHFVRDTVREALDLSVILDTYSEEHGYFHINLAEVHTAEGRLYLLVAIDGTTKFAFVELHEEATRRVAGDFLRHLIEAVPYTVHTVLTDNGTHFTTPGNVASAASIIRHAIAAGETFRAHSFELACARNDIDHRLTKPRHAWTNGQIERMTRRAARSSKPHDQGRDGQTLPL